MSRYHGPRLRIVRRLGKLPGLTRKINRKKNKPGQQPKFLKKKKVSKFNIRLQEKQKLRFHYGIGEKQLLNYMKKAKKKKSSSGRILLRFLEMRLDNLVYRLGFARTIPAAKQLISHGHILVNNKSVNISSFNCKPNDIIKVKPMQKSMDLVKKTFALYEELLIPLHLSLNKEQLEGKVLNFVHRKSISLNINELLIVEYYSRKL